MDDTQHYRASKDVVSEVVDGEAVLLNLSTGVYFSLNATATRLWEVLKEPVTLRHAHEVMSGEFVVEADILQHDLESLLAQFEELGLVETSGATSGGDAHP